MQDNKIENHTPVFLDLEKKRTLESFDYLLKNLPPESLSSFVKSIYKRCQFQVSGAAAPGTLYVNTISLEDQADYPGDLALESRISNIHRWNAMAMVVDANKHSDGIGGHISTYASAATLYEVGFQHFFKGEDHPDGSDLIYFQGHASPGIYARAFLEGRLNEQQLKNFRREIDNGLSSYPHPWLMPEFWQFPTVSMGLGPLMAAYQARFLRYLF